jgi:hypothetical protein
MQMGMEFHVFAKGMQNYNERWFLLRSQTEVFSQKEQEASIKSARLPHSLNAGRNEAGTVKTRWLCGALKSLEVSFFDHWSV